MNNKAIHGSVVVFLSVCCWFLWGMLKLTAGFMHRVSDHPPMFTQLCVHLKWVFAVFPVLALIYCVYVCLRRAEPRPSWVGFLAATTAALMLILLPTMIAAWLPLVQFIETAARR
jgi:hypothetical protein